MNIILLGFILAVSSSNSVSAPPKAHQPPAIPKLNLKKINADTKEAFQELEPHRKNRQMFLLALENNLEILKKINEYLSTKECENDEEMTDQDHNFLSELMENHGYSYFKNIQTIWRFCQKRFIIHDFKIQDLCEQHLREERIFLNRSNLNSYRLILAYIKLAISWSFFITQSENLTQDECRQECVAILSELTEECELLIHWGIHRKGRSTESLSAELELTSFFSRETASIGFPYLSQVEIAELYFRARKLSFLQSSNRQIPRRMLLLELISWEKVLENEDSPVTTLLKAKEQTKKLKALLRKKA